MIAECQETRLQEYAEIFINVVHYASSKKEVERREIVGVTYFYDKDDMPRKRVYSENECKQVNRHTFLYTVDVN